MSNLRDAFWSHVNRDTESGCWLWTGYVLPNGYGYTYRPGSAREYAHRLSYEDRFGPIDDGAQIDHTCHERSCVNPGHLRAVTGAQNRQNRSGARKGNQSGVRGVERVKLKNRDKWSARATLNRKRYYLGCYDTIAEAAAVISEWRRKNMPYSVMDQGAAPTKESQ